MRGEVPVRGPDGPRLHLPLYMAGGVETDPLTKLLLDCFAAGSAPHANMHELLCPPTVRRNLRGRPHSQAFPRFAVDANYVLPFPCSDVNFFSLPSGEFIAASPSRREMGGPLSKARFRDFRLLRRRCELVRTRVPAA